MTKVVLSRDTKKKELSLCTKLHYLENKCGKKPVVFISSDVSDNWIKINNPYSICDEKGIYFVVYMKDNLPDIIDTEFITRYHPVISKVELKSSNLTLDNLRFENAFIKVIEDGDNKGDEYLKVVELDSFMEYAGIRIENNEEVIITHTKWHTSKFDYQFIEYIDAQDIDELKQFVDGTNYKIINMAGLGIYLDDTTRFFHQCIKEGDYIIKTKLNNIYVVNKETFDNMEVDNG